MLPQIPTGFVGRERELAELASLLKETRLLTLVGPGGCGKTRLALEVAAALTSELREDAYFVDLAPIRQPWLVDQALATAVGVGERPGSSLVEAVCKFLGVKPALVVLDNCEHLVDAAAAAVVAILRACPSVRIVATGREALRLPDERCYSVPPLQLHDATRLFIQCARRSAPEFELGLADARLVHQLCQRLDRLPLAIELAAGRMRALPLSELVIGLQESFDLLGSGLRTAPDRQQTLRATLDWSHLLLTEDERTCLHRLAVFAGGCDREAALAVCKTNLDTLVRLAEKSMLVVEAGSGEPARYRLLETVREYAAEKLGKAKEAKATHRRHALWYLRRAEQAASSIREEARSARLLEADHDNLRAALDWSHLDDAGLELRLAVALGWFWFQRGYLREGGRRLSDALVTSARSERGALHAAALKWAGTLARDHLGLEAAQAFYWESLEISQKIGDEAGEADTLHRIANAQIHLAQYDLASDHYAKSLATFERLGDAYMVAVLHFHHGLLARFRGDFANARRWLQTSEAELRQLGNDFHLAQALSILGMVELEAGNLPVAGAKLNEALSIGARLEMQFSAAIALDGLSAHASLTRHHQRALRLAGAAEAVRASAGIKMFPDYHEPLERWRASARRSLGAAAALAYQEGRDLSLYEAIEYALGEHRHQLLSARELQIAGLVTQGLTNREIAQRLGIATRTAEGHVERLRNKLGFRSRSQIAAWATDRTANSGSSTLAGG